MAPQRCKVPISVVAVNFIVHIDWLDMFHHIRPIWMDIIINAHSFIKHTNKAPSFYFNMFKE